MAATYTLIASNILSSSSASVAFTSISNEYTDLILRMSTKSTQTTTGTFAGYFQFNSSGASAYSTTYNNWLSSASGNLTSGKYTNSNEIQNLIINSSNAIYSNVFNNAEIYIPNYANTTFQKPTLSYSVAEMNNTTGYDLSTVASGLWRNTSAISSITIYPQGGSWESGSSFYLYGIKKS